MELKADLWFPSIIFAGINEDINLDFLKVTASNLKGDDNSNEWCSEAMSNFDDLELDKKLMMGAFQSELDKAVDHVCKSIGFPAVALKEFRLHDDGPGTYNTQHNNPGSLLSGLFFVNIPEDNMGDVQFFRDDESSYYLPTLDLYNNITTKLATYKPQAGLMLIFPSWIKHATTMNNSDKNRLVVSFNYGVKQ
jgi:uncharacterized protein (TIGR02466 family)|tara:strand:+ start:2888 stop:3466 length:579 start_codon:yes stop_codon:yes gene_type:complete